MTERAIVKSFRLPSQLVDRIGKRQHKLKKHPLVDASETKVVIYLLEIALDVWDEYDNYPASPDMAKVIESLDDARFADAICAIADKNRLRSMAAIIKERLSDR